MKLTQLLTVGVVAVLLTAGVAATGAVAPGETAQQEEPDSGPEEEPADEADNETDSDESAGALVVSSLNAPDSAAPGDNVTVVAEVSNDGDERTTEQVEFRVGGDVVDRQYVTLSGGESTTVTFTALAGAETGDVRHGVFTESDGQIATLTVSESFALDSVDAPAEADTGGNATVAATVSNPNDFTTSQPVTFRLEGETVAQQTVTLAGGATTTVNFTLSTEDVATGTYVHSVFTRDAGQFLELEVTEPGPDEAAVTFDDQTTNGTSVTVQNLSLPSDGYVVIHNESLLDGDAVGSVIGVSEYLETGQYEDVTVDLYDVPGATFNASELEENATLIAMPHNETTNDPTYDFVSTNGTADPPFLVDGEAVTDDAAITVGDDEPPADNETEVPGNDTDAPDNETDVPADNETEAPGNDTEAPTEEAPDSGTEAPTDGEPTTEVGEETDTGTTTEAPTDGETTTEVGPVETDSEPTATAGTETTATATAAGP